MKLLDCLIKPTYDTGWGDLIPNDTGALYYQDNGSSILGVAHLDYVLRSKPTKCRNRIYALQLDDRLGVWVLSHLLPKMGIQLDLLFTDCEESGRSTAEHFIPTKQYNWIVEFDRNGDDVVCYEYETPELVDKLIDHQFTPGIGSFSDICSLSHLGVQAINIGTGYYNEHSNECYADLSVTKKQAQKFASFHQEYKDILLPHSAETYDDWDIDKYSYWGEHNDDLSQLSEDDWYSLENLSEYYGYKGITEFLDDGGIQLLGTNIDKQLVN